jgi:hypothetical protein
MTAIAIAVTANLGLLLWYEGLYRTLLELKRRGVYDIGPLIRDKYYPSVERQIEAIQFTAFPLNLDVYSKLATLVLGVVLILSTASLLNVRTVSRRR